MTSITHRIRKAVAAIAVGALSLAGVATAATAANAAEGNIDTSKTGSITIHKYQNNGTASGTVDGTTTATGGTPLEGIVFSYAKVEGIDLTSNAGWKALDGLTVSADGQTVTNTAGGSFTVGGATTMAPTSAEGTATVQNLDLGVYVVTETDASGAKADGASVDISSKSAPFLVSIPTSYNKAWVYDVHVYPKNSVVANTDKPVKTVAANSKTYFPGDTITWEISQVIPDLGKDAQGSPIAYSKYEVSDTLPAGVNSVTTSNVKVYKDGVELIAAQATVNVSTDGKTVTIALTQESLADLTAGETIKITIEATVSETATDLSNQADVTVNDATFQTTSDPNEPEEPTVTQFRDLTIVATTTDAKPLAGATYTIVPVDENGTPIEGVTPKTVTTGDDGRAVQRVAAGNYLITETTAPVGYEIPTDYVSGQVKTVVATDDIDADVTANTVTVEHASVDESNNGLFPNLPVTGAQGALLLTILGLAIMGLAAGTGFVAARKNREN